MNKLDLNLGDLVYVFIRLRIWSNICDFSNAFSLDSVHLCVNCLSGQRRYVIMLISLWKLFYLLKLYLKQFKNVLLFFVLEIVLNFHPQMLLCDAENVLKIVILSVLSQ